MGGMGGEAPPGKQGGLGGAGPVIACLEKKNIIRFEMFKHLEIKL